MADALLGGATGPGLATSEEGAPAPPADAAERLGAAGAGTGRSTFERISSLGPNAWTRPSAIISTRSTLASALGRWATTTTMPPRERAPTIRWVGAFSPWAPRFELGSSSTTRNGAP